MIDQGLNVREAAMRLKIGKTALYAALAGGGPAGEADRSMSIPGARNS